MVSNYKEVYYDPYCAKCLNHPVNEFSHRPVKFEENE